jgi:hypothetical protein
MSPGLRKFLLATHLTCSVGWVGAVVAYLVLGVAAATSEDVQTVQAAWIGMEMTGWLAIVPLAFGALLTGVLLSLSTPWGLFRHYWVVISLMLTIFATLVLVLHMPSVTATAQLARVVPPSQPGHLGGDLLHSGVGLLVLLLITWLNVYKPQGLTPYGWRKQQAQRRSSPPV